MTWILASKYDRKFSYIRKWKLLMCVWSYAKYQRLPLNLCECKHLLPLVDTYLFSIMIIYQLSHNSLKNTERILLVKRTIRAYIWYLVLKAKMYKLLNICVKQWIEIRPFWKLIVYFDNIRIASLKIFPLHVSKITMQTS